MDLLLGKTVDNLKGECTCTTCLREIVREVTWLATVIARRIQSCTVLTRDKSCVVFCSYSLLIKDLFCELFLLASSSNPMIIISWWLLFSPNPTFCADQKIQCWCGCDKIIIPAQVVLVPQFLQQETAPILVGAYKEKNCLHIANLNLLFLRRRPANLTSCSLLRMFSPPPSSVVS